MLAQMRTALATISFVATALLCHSAVYAQSLQSGSFVADSNNGCKVWNPHPQSNESVTWSGACANGFAQGGGNLQWVHDGKPYEKDEGEWNEGRQSGRGSQDWSLGRYDGEIVNGEPQGRGVLKLRSSRYEGEFRNGKPNGTGAVTSPEGFFKGNWKDGCLEGDKRRIAFGVPSSTCH
ncbi:hypothetical protein [Bradyrhizobium sp.]|jgi:hypothetical protein|uniref:hypothetical protein n=1 Tax=Bradyrhizobium sp. TaxID=376 RepID=UPI003C1D1121